MTVEVRRPHVDRRRATTGRSAPRTRSASRPSSSSPRTTTSGRPPPLTDAHVAAFRAALDETGVVDPVAHNSYLINLASPDDALWDKSIDAMAVEVERCEALGIADLVVHPGAHVGSGEEAAWRGSPRGSTRSTAGPRGLASRSTWRRRPARGRCLGHRFEHLGADPRPRRRAGAAGRLRGHLPYFRGGLFPGDRGGVR